MKKQLLVTMSNSGEGRDEAARIVAELFGVSSSYVRKLLAGTRTPKKEKGKEKAKAIIEAYVEYKKSKKALKNNLIRAIEKTIVI